MKLALITTTLGLACQAAFSKLARGRWFHKYILVMLENQDYQYIVANDVFKSVADKGVLHSNYHAKTHPSQPNYWATIAGSSTFPGNTYVANTTNPIVVTGRNGDDAIDIQQAKTVVDLLEPAGLTYKIYSENYPTSGKCYFGSGYGVGSAVPAEDQLYKRKHNPFISFNSFTSNSTRCARQHDFDDFYADLESGDLPDFSYVVPNQENDNHDTSIEYTATWYEQFISTVLASPAFQQFRIAVHVVYDEDGAGYVYNHNKPFDSGGSPNPYYNSTCSSSCPPAGCTDLLNCTLDTSNNQVYSVLLGSAIPRYRIGTTDSSNYSHYSILATLEANWRLNNLGLMDVDAKSFSFWSLASFITYGLGRGRH